MIAALLLVWMRLMHYPLLRSYDRVGYNYA